MLLAGLFGGAVNYFLIHQIDDKFSKSYLIFKSLFLGVAAAILVPLFLNTIGSNILSFKQGEPYPD